MAKRRTHLLPSVQATQIIEVTPHLRQAQGVGPEAADPRGSSGFSPTARIRPVPALARAGPR